MTTLVRSMASWFVRIGALQWLTPQLPLRLDLWWLLLLLLFPAGGTQSTNIGPHLLLLLRRQELHHLQAGPVPQLMNLRFLLIRCQRFILVHGIQLRFRGLVNFLHSRFLIIGQVQSFHRAMHSSFVLRRLALVLRRWLCTALCPADSRRKTKG